MSRPDGLTSGDGSTDMGVGLYKAQAFVAGCLDVSAASTFTDLITAPGEPARLTACSRADPPVAMLRVQRGPYAGRRFVLSSDAVTTLGRHAENTIVLSSVTVSRRHAEIRPESGHFVLVDLGSLSGSFVNRQPIDTAILAEGDELTIGAFRLVFHA